MFLNFNSEWNLVLHLEIWDYLFNSLSIIFFQSILVIFFGVSTAWFVTIYDFPYKNIINLLLLLPLSIPPYIAAIAYGEIFDYSIYSRFSLLKDLFSLDNASAPSNI